MKKYKVYLFDFDGTLFDTSKGLNYVFKEAFKVAGVKVEDKDIPYLSRVPLKESFDTLGGDYNKADEFVKRIEEALDEEPAIKTTLKFPEIDEFLSYIKNNDVLCGIVTSNNVNHVFKILDFFHLDHDYFKTYIGVDKSVEVKPSPKPILMALSELGYKGDLKDVVYIGDSHNDCLAAINAGISYSLIERDEDRDLEFPKIYSLMELFY